MKAKPSWVLCLGMLVAPLAASGVPSPTPTSSPVQTAPPTPVFTPWPTSTPLVAPTWAPMSAGAVPEAMKPKKPSPWLSSIGLGAGVPLSGNLQTAYSAGFHAGLGTGLKVTDQISLWANFDLGLYNSRNDALTKNSDFTFIEGVLGLRYRFLDSDVSPYLFGGPGIAYNEYRSNQGAVIDPATGYGYIPVNAYEFDFLAEGGVGLDVRMAKGMSAFLQGKMTYDFMSASFAGYGSTDSPLVIMPFEIGIIFGIGS